MRDPSTSTYGSGRDGRWTCRSRLNRSSNDDRGGRGPVEPTRAPLRPRHKRRPQTTQKRRTFTGGENPYRSPKTLSTDEESRNGSRSSFGRTVKQVPTYAVTRTTPGGRVYSQNPDVRASPLWATHASHTVDTGSVTAPVTDDDPNTTEDP